MARTMLGVAEVSFTPPSIMDELKDMLSRATRTVNRESDHTCDWRISRRGGVQAEEFIVVCRDCKQFARYSHYALTLYTHGVSLLDEAGRQMATAVAQLMERPCNSLGELQVIAEFVTHRLAAAGQTGLPFPQLVEEVFARHEQECRTQANVVRAVHRLGLSDELVDVPGTQWRLPVMRLPDGHPLRTW